MKKKTKRVDVRSLHEGQSAARWQKFCDTGSPISLAMLLGFVIIASLILSFQPQFFSSDEFDRTQATHQLASTFLVLLVLSFVMGAYVYVYEPRVVKDHLNGLSLLSMMLLMFVVVRMILQLEKTNYLVITPIMITLLVTIIAYTRRLALGISCIFALMSVYALRDNYITQNEGLSILMAIGVGMGIAAMLLGDIRSRRKIVKISALAGVVVFVMIWIIGYSQQHMLFQIFVNSLLGATMAIFAGLVIEGMLPWVEKAFGTATNMTLLDYTEANKPLLKRLAVEAPGTFNHSWQVGMMAEAAAEAIGANGLLCRVGSYYHDIGKLNKPRFFVENQGESFNQHEGLSATMSKMIIIGHVKDGIELAKEYRLPKALRQFIETHHGTTLVEFFYHKASQAESENGSSRSLDETDFRYPGPKPQNRETGIVMLCDSVEGAARALADPTPTRIEHVVNSILMKRLLDGQFNECDLTMRELHLIEASLVKTLCGMYHGRIAYPTKTDKPKSNGHHKQDKKDNNDASEPVTHGSSEN